MFIAAVRHKTDGATATAARKLSPPVTLPHVKILSTNLKGERTRVRERERDVHSHVSRRGNSKNLRWRHPKRHSQFQIQQPERVGRGRGRTGQISSSSSTRNEIASLRSFAPTARRLNTPGNPYFPGAMLQQTENWHGQHQARRSRNAFMNSVE